jgi:disulfide bond formation protein DsbB
MGFRRATLVVTPRRPRVRGSAAGGRHFRRSILLNLIDGTAPRARLMSAVVWALSTAYTCSMWWGWNLARCASSEIRLLLVVLVAGSRPSRSAACWAAVADAGRGFGAFVAARQSFLQWYPPEISSCGRDFYGMIETFPLQRAIPMIFKGSGDCTKIDWTFLGASLANWSFIWFAVFTIVALMLLARLVRRRGPRHALQG